MYNKIMLNYYYFNHIIVISCGINICIDYENQSQSVRFITDCIDFFFFCIYLVEMIFRYIVHKRYKPNS